MDNRYFFEKQNKDTIELDKTETAHLVKVRRAKVGDTITGFCGDGYDYTLRVDEIGKTTMCSIIDKQQNKAVDVTPVTVFLSTLKNDALNESIDNNTAKVICDYLEEHNINYCVMTSEKYFAKRKDEYVIAYQDVCHTTAVEVGEKSLYDYIIENNYLFNKILLLMDKTEKQKYFNLLFDKFSSLACVSYSAYPLVEITPYKCSKGGAIDFLSKYYHIEKDEIIAVGDSLNDATMAEYAGLTFAVKNADKEFKDLVEIFDCTNDDDAVAKIIEKYTL